MSAGQHIIEVEKINSAEQATTSVTVDVSHRVVSFTDMQCTYIHDNHSNSCIFHTLIF